MLTVAIDIKTGKDVSISSANPSHDHKCKYCGTPVRPYGHHHFSRVPGAPEHSNQICIDLVSHPPSNIERQLKLTKKATIFNWLGNGTDRLEPRNPVIPPQVDPDDPINLPNPPHHLDVPPTPISINQLEGVADVIPGLAEHIQTMRHNHIDQINLNIDDLEALDITIDEALHLTDSLNTQEHALTGRDIQVLAAVINDNIQRTTFKPRPIRTLRQFNEANLIFLPPDTQLQNCCLIDLFLSYYHDEYKAHFMSNYKELGQRILYCSTSPLRVLDESDRPSLKFTMFWRKPNTRITLYINFEDRGAHSAKEIYENFIRQTLEQRVNDEGAMTWVPRNATRNAIDKGRFSALVFGDWRHVEKYERYSDGTHYITLRSNYSSMRQILFVPGYEA